MTLDQHRQRIGQLELRLHIADYGMGMPRDYQRVLELRVMLKQAQEDAIQAAGIRKIGDRYFRGERGMGFDEACRIVQREAELDMIASDGVEQ